MEDDMVPAIDLPDETEFTSIVRKAVEESKLFEPFMLLEKRVLRSICQSSSEIFTNRQKKTLEDEFEFLNRSDRLDNAPQQKLAMLEAKQISTHKKDSANIFTMKLDSPFKFQIEALKQTPSARAVSLPFKFSSLDLMQKNNQLMAEVRPSIKKLDYIRADSGRFSRASESEVVASRRNSQASSLNKYYALDQAEIVVEVPSPAGIMEDEPLKNCDDPDFISLLQVADEEVSAWDRAGSGDNV